jgi:hypothetical protein
MVGCAAIAVQEESGIGDCHSPCVCRFRGEIQGFLAEMYAVDMSLDFISGVTDTVMSEVTAWQSRPLEAMYPVVFFDALRVNICEDAVVRNRAVCAGRAARRHARHPRPVEGAQGAGRGDQADLVDPA